MKIIGIVGSPRKGNTEIMVNESIAAAKEAGADTQMILLGNVKLEMCDGCLLCDESGKCHYADGMNEINEDLAKSDGFLIGTPARWRLLSGNLKVFFDRTNPLAVPKKLTGKKVGIIAVGQSEGESAISIKKAAESVAFYCEDSGMEVIGTVLGEGALKEGDISKNKKVLKECKELGRKLVRAINKAKAV